ncbi:MotA/TolQ/ExbB proton channel family protein [Pararobbsia silviterrae]|uniref:Biopolymer transport protein ExbB n=1 Tax=Pararobbsia silviterrae TaxID=1792498 RepID=A0A494XEN6_9BURK|nr:MotA/TolQ/ExbB proton channel family protein [Pararobbsia silviterrae]RKP46609.1 MotA/TolQ/ExbB proton channel family protein [Pararobbsia silviterrae]
MQSYGIAHVWAEGDFVTHAIGVVLAAMSIISWTVIVLKLTQLWRVQRITQRTEAQFWNASDYASGLQALNSVARNPYAALAASGHEAAAHHAASAPQLRDRLDISEWITRALKNSIDDTIVRLQGGLAVLGSIGSVAPFVGLFGTVWGIYHALLSIGASGQASLEHVAGPVGEALIMTAFGLFVAIPAVLGFNALSRGNKAFVTRLNRFAHALHALLVTGGHLSSESFSVTANLGFGQNTGTHANTASRAATHAAVH